MKYLLIFFPILLVSSFVFGQKVVRVDKEAYVSNRFSYEFYMFTDSTCYLKGHYQDNASYFLYKGQLTHQRDTMYEFRFQPVVSFGCNKRFGSNDRIVVHLTQRDTALLSLNYMVTNSSGLAIPIQLQLGHTTSYIAGASKGFFVIDTHFNDPLTNEAISMTVDQSSEPDLTYYGTNTAFETVQLSIHSNKLTIYPDHRFIWDKETFIWQQ